MAAIHDLLAQIQDEALRNRIEQEVDKLSKTKKFGLVFEEHLPECTPLYDMPIITGNSSSAINIFGVTSPAFISKIHIIFFFARSDSIKNL